MIVVDTNVIAYAALSGPRRDDADRALARDRAWAAPPLWRSEFRNVLSRTLRAGRVSREDALLRFIDAERLIGNRERAPSTPMVLDLARVSGCTAYDCECVAVAMAQRARLVTEDRQVLRAFPEIALSLAAFAAGG